MTVPNVVDPLYRALYFSTIISGGFYGVTCMQTFFYYINYQEDQLRTKILVAALWALNTVHEALVVAGVWKSFMSALVNPLSIVDVVQELVLLLMTLILVPTQGFFIYRIYMFSDKKIIIPLIWLPLGLWELTATILYVVKAFDTTSQGLGGPYFTGIGVSYYGVAAAVDISIAIFLTCLLMRRRKKITLFVSSAKVLQLLSVFAINTGIWTAIFALLSIVPMRANPFQLTYVVFGFPLCSIYCNTLLANLNARAYVKSRLPVFNGVDAASNMHRLSMKENFSGCGLNRELKFVTSTHAASKDLEQMAISYTAVVVQPSTVPET